MPGIYIPKPFRAQKRSPCGLFPKPRIPVSVMIPGLKTSLAHKHGWTNLLARGIGASRKGFALGFDLASIA